MLVQIPLFVFILESQLIQRRIVARTSPLVSNLTDRHNILGSISKFPP